MNFDRIKEALNGRRCVRSTSGKDYLSYEEICKMIDEEPSLAAEEHKEPYDRGEDLPTSLAYIAAGEGNNNAVLQCLIKNGAELNKMFLWHETPLHAAARQINIETVLILLDAGADPTIKSPKGKTVLEVASSSSVSDFDYRHIEPRDVACSKQLKIVELLLSRDPSPLSDSSTNLLHRAANSGNVELIKFYLAQGLSFETRDSDGFTPICTAAYESNFEVFKYLKDKGADLSVITNNGRNLAHLAARGNNPDIVRELIGSGINMNTQDEVGKFPIHYLVHSGYTQIHAVKQILEFDVFEINPPTACYSTLSEAKKTEKAYCRGLVELMISHGAEGLDTEVNLSGEDGHFSLED